MAHRCLSVVVALLLLGLVGCGRSGRDVVVFGKATPERRAEFVGAVVRACAEFDGLDGPDVKFEVTTNDSRCTIAVTSETAKTAELQGALSVALTNLSLDYPGLGFMLDDDGITWRILMPPDMRIPVSGSFGIGGE